MQIERAEIGAITVLRLQGDLDENGVNALRDAFYECLRAGRFHLVLNMSEVRYISYLGVGVMVERLRKVRSFKGDLKLAGLNLHANRLFRMVGVSSLFETYENEAQALRVFQEAA